MIVFIAEIIIASAISLSIHNLNKKVIILNNKIIDIIPKLQEVMKKARDSAQNLVKTTKQYYELLEERKNKYIFSIVKNILVSVVLLLAKGKQKKILSGIELAISLRNFLACK